MKGSPSGGPNNSGRHCWAQAVRRRSVHKMRREMSCSQAKNSLAVMSAIAPRVISLRCQNSDDDIGRERDQLCRVFASEIGVAQRQAGLDLQVAIFDPPQLIETVIECRNPRSRFKIILRDVSDYANTLHALWRLRPCARTGHAPAVVPRSAMRSRRVIR